MLTQTLQTAHGYQWGWSDQYQAYALIHGLVKLVLLSINIPAY